MTYKELLNNIENISANIKQDEDRLLTIINAINTGDVNLDINDKLLNNLNKISFSDKDNEASRDYIALILSNLESQKLNNTKNVTEEFIKVLSHNLRTLDSLQLLVSRIKSENIIKDTVKEEVIKTDNTVSAWDRFKPTTAISNIMFYGIVLFIVIFVAIEVDKKTTNYALKTVKNITRPVPANTISTVNKGATNAN